MNKQEFLAHLRKGLSGLPQNDIEKRLNFYGEMLEDRMEEGLSEAEAVSAVGSVDEIVAQIIADTPIAKLAKERIRPKRQLKTWESVLLALGSPLWISLGIAAVAVIFALYISLCAVVMSLKSSKPTETETNRCASAALSTTAWNTAADYTAAVQSMFLFNRYS